MDPTPSPQPPVPAPDAAEVLIAPSGLLLVLFLVLHLGGVSLALLAPARFERWAALLHGAPWLAPLELLLAALVLHPLLALRRSFAQAAALGPVRPVRRSRRSDGWLAPLAARWQPWSGALLLLFLVVHLLQLRWQRPQAGLEREALLAVLHQPHWLLLYLLASLALIPHLVQGVEAAHRSLGLLDPANAARIRRWGRGLAWLVGAGFALLALALPLAGAWR
ncbi:MAG: succinate dehydrogenase [Synechococcaceae cyanobacterium]|nr:succinate dehydrogenase [Synechococcaceae cyanobacterium]